MPAKLVAILGACRRRGRWEVSGVTNAFVVFGHCHIDFREAYADPELEKMKFNVICLLGNVSFLMPDGADVRPSAVSMFASTEFDVPVSESESPLPKMLMETTTLLGRCRVRVVTEEDEQEEPADDVESADDPPAVQVLEQAIDDLAEKISIAATPNPPAEDEAA